MRIADPKKDLAVIDSFLNGMSVKEISVTMGIKQNTVYNILNRHGVKIKENTVTSSAKAIVGMYKALNRQKGCQSKIARELGVSRQYVNKIIKRYENKNPE